MRTVSEYLHFKGKDGYDFSDSFREVMIYQMINTFEQDKLPEQAVDVDDYHAESDLTLMQKKRIRRELMRKANAYVKEHPDTSVNDPEVIENAFFETNFGKQYSYLRSEWQQDERQNMIDLVESWTTGQEPEDTNSPKQRFRMVISPYDPMFEQSDLFSDRNDQLAYFVGCERSKSEAGIRKSDVYMSVGEYNASGKDGVKKGFLLHPRPNGGNDLDIAAVHLGSGRRLEPYNDETINKYGNPSTLMSLEGDVTKSGYNSISRYIKTNTGKMEVRDFLLEQTTGDNLPLSSDELHFMEETCKWLSDSGIDFDIEVSEMNNNRYLTARLSNHRDIRLLDRDDPFYQGRIYDEGSVVYMSVPTFGKKDDAALERARKNVTWQDRLNGIKWYFGEEVNIGVDPGVRGKIKSYGEHVGEFSVVRGRNPGNYIYGAGKAGVLSSVYKSNTSGMTTMVAVAYKSYDNTVLPVNMRIEARPSSYNRVVPSALTGSFSAQTIRDTLNNNLSYIPEDSIYPQDRALVDVDALDEEGNPTGETVSRYGISEDFSTDRTGYYKHVYVREKLSSWVDSAKETHRQGVDIDGLVATYNESISSNDPELVPSFDDEDFEEIRRLYWDVLTGVKETGKNSNNQREASEQTDVDIDIDAFDDDVYSASLEDKIRIIKEHYEHYLDDAFGTVPELHKPFLSDEENTEIDKRNETAGFNPSMVAKFMKSDGTASVQNLKYIQHMLKQLDDEYNHGYLKDGIYMSDEIRKSMVKYDSKTAVCQRYSSELGRNIGLTPYDMFDDYGNVDYESIYKAAPLLRDKPVTTDMLLHTVKSLQQSGIDNSSIEVNVDDNGIISYRGVQNVNLAGHSVYDRSKNYPKVISKMNSNNKTEAILVSGEIGQVFEPDENGCIIPNYGGMGEASKVIIPGYDAHLVMGESLDSSSVRDRLRLFDWKHMMKQAITSEIRRASFSNPAQYEFLPTTTSLNNVYKHSYDMKISVEEYRERLDPESDIYKMMQPVKDSIGQYMFDDEGNMKTELVSRSRNEVLAEINTFKASIDTLKERCRFDNNYAEGATTRAQSMLEHPSSSQAKSFDYYYSDLNGNRNFRVLDEEFDGVFDVNMTATAKNQGIVRYLLPGVKVDSTTGKVEAIDYDWHDKNNAAELMKDSMMQYASHDSWDRRLMATTQLLTSLHTPRDVGVAFLNLEGDNYDDGMTVSIDFARRYLVKGADGNLRSLMPQDKLSDTHGNKGVISRVVDPTQRSSHMIKEISGWDISDPDHSTVEYRGKQYDFKYDILKKHEDGSEFTLGEQAVEAIQKKLGINDKICEFFDKNKNLDVVMSPYSGMTRHNGGSIREMMQKPEKLWVDGKIVEGGMGHMNMIVVDMLADVKTHFYDEDMIREGKGRKASSQLLWILEGKRATEITREMYNYNDKAWDNLREYMIVTGLDINEKLEPGVGYKPQTKRGEHRKLMELPDDETLAKATLNKDGSVNKLYFKKTGIEANIIAEMDESGGFMEVPFELKFNSLKYTKKRIPGMDDADFVAQKSGNVRKVGNGEIETYGVPVLPPNLRSGQVFVDGTMQAHDYTNWYSDIHKSGVEYMVCKTQADELDDKIRNGEFSGKDLAEKKELLDNIRNNMESSKAKAQHSFDKIVSDIVNRQFNTKHNVFRDQCMASRLPSSATAVISADSKLKSDQVAMSHESAMCLGIMGYDNDKQEYYWMNRTLNKDGSVRSKGNGRVLIFRDPILRDGAMRCMDVVIDDTVKGIKINPALGNSFSGDFDGDSYGIYAPHTKAAQQEAYSKFHISNNMLDLGEKDPETGKYPLYISKGMDMASNAYADPSGKIQKMHDDLEEKANKLQAFIDSVAEDKAKLEDFEFEARVAVTEMRGNRRVISRDEDGDIIYDKDENGQYKTQILHGKEAITACKLECKRDLDDYLKAAFDGIGTAHIVVKSPETVVASLQSIVDSGAKGSADKMRDLLDNVGIDYQTDDDGKAIPETAKNITHLIDGREKACPRIISESEAADENLAREKDKVVQRASAYKADDTATGGMISQHLVSAVRNSVLENDSYKQNPEMAKDLEQFSFVLTKALDMSSRFTQSILDSKQDAQKAMIKDEIFNFWGDDVLAGYKLSGDWKSDDPKVIQSQAHNRVMRTVVDPYGQPVQAREKGADGKYYPKYDESGQPIYEKYCEKCSRSEWIQQMKGFLLAADVKYNDKTIEALADVFTSDKPMPLTRADGSTIQYYDINDKQVKTAMGPKGKIDGMYDHAQSHGALFDKLAYDGRYTSLVEASYCNSDAYRINRGDPSIKPSGSVMGNAVEKGVEIYGYQQQRKAFSRNDPESKELSAQIAQIKLETDASGLPLPGYIAKAIYDDENGGSSRPIGSSRSLSKDERNRYMGESTEAYEQRMKAIDEREAAENLQKQEPLSEQKSVAQDIVEQRVADNGIYIPIQSSDTGYKETPRIVDSFDESGHNGKKSDGEQPNSN